MDHPFVPTSAALHRSALHPDWKMMDKPHTPPTTAHARPRDSPEKRPCAKSHGTYHDPECGTPTCHHCGARLISATGTVPAWQPHRRFQLSALRLRALFCPGRLPRVPAGRRFTCSAFGPVIRN